MARGVAACLIVFVVANCAAPPLPTETPVVVAPLGSVPAPWSEARIVDNGPPLECVPYARQVSGINLHGDAATWWDQASDHYDRGWSPRPGAVLAFRPARKSSGHVAVVMRVVSASHANWLNQGRIHENTPILDVSVRNDWSAVRVWYTPGNSWGAGVYPTHGFIYAAPMVTADR